MPVRMRGARWSFARLAGNAGRRFLVRGSWLKRML